MKIPKISHRLSRSLKYAKLAHFTSFSVFQMIAKKRTKIYNARSQPLFCSLNVLFSDVVVALCRFCPGVPVHKGITIVLSLVRSHWLAVVYYLVLCSGSCEPVHEDRTPGSAGSSANRGGPG